MSKTFVEPTITEIFILWILLTFIQAVIACRLYRTMGKKHLEKNTKEILENHIGPDEEIIEIEQGAISKFWYALCGPWATFSFSGLMLLFWKGGAEFALIILTGLFFFYLYGFFHFFTKFRARVIVFTNKSFVIFLEQNKIKKILLDSIKECNIFGGLPLFVFYYKDSFGERKDRWWRRNADGCIATKITYKITRHVNSEKGLI